MSSQRKAAFARVPRNPTKEPKKPDLIRIDANYLSKFEKASMNPDLGTVMNKTNSRLHIEVGAAGAPSYNLWDSAGKVVADKADILRIQTMGSNITKERKQALGEEVGLRTRATIAAFVQKGAEIGRPIPMFHKGFLPVYRSVNTQYDILARNNEAIEAHQTKDPGAETVRKALIEMGRRTSSAIGEYMYHRATLGEEETPLKLNHFLRVRFVPVYFYNRLTGAIVNTSAPGFDIKTLVFPKDPTKGFYLTFREIREIGMEQNLLGLGSGSNWTIAMARNDKLIRAMCNLAGTAKLTDFEEKNSLGSKLANTAFFMVPPRGMYDYKEVVNYLAKNGSRGVVWNSGVTTAPTDLLKYYGTIAKRMFYALLPRPAIKVGLIEELFSGFSYDNEKEEKDVFVQLKSWAGARNIGLTRWGDIFTDPTNIEGSPLVLKVFCDVVGVPLTENPIAIQFTKMVSKGLIPLQRGEIGIDPPLFTEVKNLAVTLRDTRSDLDRIIGDRISLGSFKKKDPSKLRSGVNERSLLSGSAKQAITMLIDRGYNALASRLRVWFRLFLDESVQSAVAELFIARMDSFLATPLTLSREERSGFIELDDPDPEEEEGDDQGEAEENENPDER